MKRVTLLYEICMLIPKNVCSVCIILFFYLGHNLWYTYQGTVVCSEVFNAACRPFIIKRLEVVHDSIYVVAGFASAVNPSLLYSNLKFCQTFVSKQLNRFVTKPTELFCHHLCFGSFSLNVFS
jgi:hypothetical protein